MFQTTKRYNEFQQINTYSRGKTLPACWTSSYKSATETPCLLSSLKNNSNFLNSSNTLISSKSKRIQPNSKFLSKNRLKLSKKDAHRAQNTCEGRVWRFGAPIAFERRTWELLSNCLNPGNSIEIEREINIEKCWIWSEFGNWKIGGENFTKARCIKKALCWTEAMPSATHFSSSSIPSTIISSSLSLSIWLCLVLTSETIEKCSGGRLSTVLQVLPFSGFPFVFANGLESIRWFLRSVFYNSC